MATFKAEVYKHQKRSDGTWNVKIRVTHNRQKKYLSTPIYVKQDDITRSSFKLKKNITDKTDKMIEEYEAIYQKRYFSYFRNNFCFYGRLREMAER